jgi:D-aspartate ligase
VYEGGAKKPTSLDESVKRGLRILLLDGYARQVLPMSRYLNQLGATVATLNTSRMDFGYASCWPHERYLGPDPRHDLAGSLQKIRVLLKSDRFDVVIPLLDMTAELLVENKADLSQFAAIAVNEPAIFAQARDKLLTMQTCQRLGIPHPRTLDAALPELPERARAEGLDVPLVVKPRKAYGAAGFQRVERLADLPSVVRGVTEKFGPALVQEYIPQTDLQYKCEVMLDRAGKICSSVTFCKNRWFPIDGGSSTLNTTVRRADIDATCGRLLSGIGWRGYGDVDLIQDPRDGIAKIMEVNPRITGSVKICFDAGVDFARQILEETLDLPVTTYPDYEVGRHLRYMHADILWFLLSPDRWRTRPSWFDFRRLSDQIFSFRDPLPGLAYSLRAMSKLAAWRKNRNTGNAPRCGSS